MSILPTFSRCVLAVLAAVLFDFRWSAMLLLLVAAGPPVPAAAAVVVVVVVVVVAGVVVVVIGPQAFASAC